MNSPLHSPHSPIAHVADDFKDALKGLKFNNKWEIENLTVIARENTEHATAISRVIENHIKTIHPQQKLPALYVLDSIVKNVGSPYNILFGRNLYNTFMEAFRAVDDRTRSQMEQMCYTWTQAVPGSMDPKPVFPSSTTSVIDKALSTFKVNVLGSQSRQSHGLPPRPPLAGSPRPPTWGTPPTNGPHYPPPPPSAYQYSGYQQPNGYPQANGYPQPHAMPQYMYPQPPAGGGYHTPVQSQPSFYSPTPQGQQPHSPQFQRPHDFSKLQADIEALIDTIQRKRSVSPHDQSLNARLGAMLDLRTLVQTTQPAPHEWDRIRDQLVLLSQQENSPQYNTHPYTHQSPALSQVQRVMPPTPQQNAPQVRPPQQPTPQPLGQPSLAQLLAGLPPPRTSTPQNTHNFSQPPVVAPQSSSTAPPSLNNDVLALLQTSGIIPTPAPNSRPTSTQQAHSVYAPPHPPTHPIAATSSGIAPSAAVAPAGDLAALLASLSQSQPGKPSAGGQVDVQFTTASIRIPRRDLVNQRLYGAAPSQCMTCGRRFPGTAEGKARKARHLDYHFRTNQRVAEAEGTGRRGVCRAWYMNEREWIKHREVDNAVENAADRDRSGPADGGDEGLANGATNGDGESTKERTPYVRVPDAGAIQASEGAGQPINVCPICQEKFENRWHDTAQEWVWMDAVKAGGQGRVYHASCYNEVKRDQEKAEQRRLTEPMPSLGLNVGRKRKMEEDGNSVVTKSPRRGDD